MLPLFFSVAVCILQDSADETTTNGSPLNEDQDHSGNGGDTAGSLSDADTGTPPLQPLPGQLSQSVSGSGANTPTTSIPLGDNCLLVDISDALSEKDKVKFTVHTRTTFPGYAKKDFFVVRQHEEFIWLHDRFEENEEYAGYIVSIDCIYCEMASIASAMASQFICLSISQIPPCPPRPDFDASREKLQRLGEGEGNMTKEEFKKMKQELEA